MFLPRPFLEFVSRLAGTLSRVQVHNNFRTGRITQIRPFTARFFWNRNLAHNCGKTVLHLSDLFSCDLGDLACNHFFVFGYCARCFRTFCVHLACVQRSCFAFGAYSSLRFWACRFSTLSNFSSIPLFRAGGASGIRLSLVRGVFGPLGEVGPS